MNILLLILYFFVLLFLFLVVVGWMDAKVKNNKTIKLNRLYAHVYGYGVFKTDAEHPTLLVCNGILGINGTQLIFSHRHKNTVRTSKTNQDEVIDLVFKDYDPHNFSEMVQSSFGEKIEDFQFTLINTFRFITKPEQPKLLSKRKICIISFKDETQLYFFYKPSTKAEEALKTIHDWIQTEENK